MSTPNKPKPGATSLQCTNAQIDPNSFAHYQPYQDQSGTKAKNTNQQIVADKDLTKITPEAAKPNVGYRCIDRKWIAFFIIILAIGAGVLIYHLSRPTPKTITEKRTRVYTISPTENMYQSHYDYPLQDGQTGHFDVVSLSSDQNGKKEYSSTVKTPILMNSGYVEKTEDGKVVYYIDPKHLYDELNKKNTVQSRRLSQQSQQNQTQPAGQEEQSWFTDSFWKKLYDRQHEEYHVYQQEYVACEQKPGQNEGEYVYEPVKATEERLLIDRSLLTADFLSYLQQNARKEADEGTQKLNSFGSEVQKMNKNKYNTEDKIIEEVSNKQKRDLVYKVGECFDRENKKYCPKEVWTNPNIPFKVSPPFNPQEKYESRPIFTVQRIGARGQVEGKADAVGFGQNTKEYSNSGVQVQSGQNGKAEIEQLTISQKGNTYTYGAAKGVATGTSNAQVSEKSSVTESRADSSKGKVQTGSRTENKINGDTQTTVKAAGNGNIVANAVIVDKAHTSTIQAATQKDGSTSGSANSNTYNKQNIGTNVGVRTSGDANAASSASTSPQLQASFSQGGSLTGGSATTSGGTSYQTSNTKTNVQTIGNGMGVSSATNNQGNQVSAAQSVSDKFGGSQSTANTLDKNGGTKATVQTNGQASGTAAGTINDKTHISTTEGSSVFGGFSSTFANTKNQNGITRSSTQTTGNANGSSNATLDGKNHATTSLGASQLGGSSFATGGTSTQNSKTNTNVQTMGPASVASNSFISPGVQSSITQGQSQKGGLAQSSANTQKKWGTTTSQSIASGPASGFGSATTTKESQQSNVQAQSQQGGFSSVTTTTSDKKGSSTQSTVSTNNNAYGASNTIVTSHQSSSVTQIGSGQDGRASVNSFSKTKTTLTDTSVITNGPATGFTNAQVNLNGSSSYTALSSQQGGSASANSQTSSLRDSTYTSTKINSSGNSGSANINSNTNISNNRPPKN